MRAKAWLFLGIFILLASCQPTEVPTPQATLQPLRVQLTSLLEPSWLPKLHTCSEYLTQSNLVIEVRSASELERKSADLTIRTSTNLEVETQVTYLGTERLALVVNPENPLNALSHEEARAIFARTYAQWKEVPSLAALPQGFDQPIKPIFLVDPELNAFFSAIFPGLELTPATDEQAYAIEMAQQLIAETPGAIGLLPASALTPTLKQVQILAPDGKAIIWQLHVLGLTPVEPTGDVLQMLLCLQNSSQP
jgi:hypothetical protein